MARNLLSLLNTVFFLILITQLAVKYANVGSFHSNSYLLKTLLINVWLLLNKLLVSVSFESSLSLMCHFNFCTTLELRLDVSTLCVDRQLIALSCKCISFPSPLTHHGSCNEILSLNPQ